MRYFLAVAQEENVHRASERLHVSPGSLSKAVSRLEEELGINLFYRQGRNIRLTPEGIALKKRAALIIQLEEDAKIELGGQKGTLNVVISAEEILQTHFGISLSESINAKFSHARFQFLVRAESTVIQQVEDREAHFGIITGEVPHGMQSKLLAKVEFKTCASPKHHLFKTFSHAEKIPVAEVLKHAFVSPDTPILGKTSASAALDGWRDDKFPRQIRYRACGLKIMEKLVQQGHALAYLPDYYLKELNLKTLNVSDCPYSCQQTVKIICRDPDALSWVSRIWDSL